MSCFRKCAAKWREPGRLAGVEEVVHRPPRRVNGDAEAAENRNANHEGREGKNEGREEEKTISYLLLSFVIPSLPFVSFVANPFPLCALCVSAVNPLAVWIGVANRRPRGGGVGVKVGGLESADVPICSGLLPFSIGAAEFRTVA
jgi:hypothetical protein